MDKTGKASHLLQYNKGTKRWYDVYSFSYSQGIVGSLFRDITEKIRTEELLRQRDQEFRTLTQASADVVYRMNPDWSETQELHGKDFLPDTEKPSRSWLEKYILKEDQPKVQAAIQHAIDTKADFELEHRVIRADESVGWTHSHAMPLLDKHGLIVEWLGTAKDITERKKAQEALLASEKRYRELFNSMTEMFQVLELVYNENGQAVDFYYREVNPATEKIVGMNRSQMLGKRAKELFSIVEDYWLEALSQVNKTGQPARVENYSSALDKFWAVKIFKVPERQNTVAILFSDITKHKRTEEALLITKWQAETGHRQLETVLETIPVAVVIVDSPSGKISYTNKRAKELYSFDWANRSLEDNLSQVKPKRLDGSPYPFDELPAYLALKGQTVYNRELILERPDGTTYTISGSASPIVDSNGEIVSAVVIFEDITESKKTEEALRQTEERFRDVFECAAIGMTIGDMAGHVVESNFALESLLGYSKDELKGKLFSDFTYPDDVNLEWQLINEMKAGKRDFYAIEKRYIRKTGEVIWVHLTGRQILGPDKKPLIGVATVENITERKKAEEALILSEEQARQRSEELQKLMDIIPAAVWVSNDPQCKVIVGNQAANEFYEAKGDENVSAGPAGGEEQDTTRRFFWKGKELLPSELPMQQAATENREIKDAELEVLTPSLKKMTILGSAKPLLTDEGKVRGCLAVFMDVTERKKVIDALEVSEARYRSLYGNLRDPFVAVDLEGKIIESNQAYQELLGYTKEELENLTYIDLTPQKWRAMEDRIIREQILPCGYSALYEKEYRRKDGENVPVELLTYALIDQNGKTTGMAAIVRDITERKNVEKALRDNEQAAVKYARELKALHDKLELKTLEAENYASKMEALAEERARQLRDSERLSAIGATAGMVGHDIRNPLQAILGDIFLVNDNLADLPESPEKREIRESVDSITSNVSYINKIVADLQDYARQLTPEYSTFDLSNLINKTLTTIVIPDNIRLTVNAQTTRAIKCDQTYLQRSITNLINNAVQAMPSGGDLGVDCYAKNDEVYIVVSDTGTGIPAEVKPKLFTPMTTTKSKGQGLGLAVVKRLVEALGGKVSFESQEGKGTKFTIELPITPHPKSKEL
ncbi:MAG: PAS domain S-box protein [Candidatus Bathyarchaeota archaeon]|nr:PAS domain S-box protein [Candidatus Bathyarchaeota archaeon]